MSESQFHEWCFKKADRGLVRICGKSKKFMVLLSEVSPWPD